MGKGAISSFRVNCYQAELRGEILGKGTPILLIHGWPLDRRIFTPQIAQMSQHFTVITYDRRGFGESSGKPDLRHELDDITTLLNKCTEQPVHLLGMSQGARIALRYCVKNSHRLRSLVLQGGVVDGLSISEPANEQIPTADYAKLVQQGRIEEVRRHWLKHPMMRVDTQHQSAIELLNHILRDYQGADLMDYSEENYHFPLDMLSALEEIQLPTLLLTGTNETRARKEYARSLLQGLPNAREKLFNKSGHLSNLTESSLYNQSVIDFCTEIDASEKHSQSPNL